MTFSIITVVYNGEDLIEGTMQSVLNQTFTDFEYLIIDGASKDNTMMIVEKYKSLITHHSSLIILSEPDKGLYDAMNKGLKLAKGDFVLFLNCGDRFFNNKVLENVAAQIKPDTDVLYGETMLVDENRTHLGTRTAKTVQKLPEKLTWQSLKYGMVVCHQSFFVARSIAPFYIDNNLAADIDWVIECLKRSRGIVNTHTLISEFLVGGISKQRHKQSLKDRYTVFNKHFGVIGNFFNHIYIAFRSIL